MKVIDEILNNISHRPFEIPKGNWKYYQEWNRALFLHWVIPFELLRRCVPSNLNLDTFEGNCYISLVAFTMEKIRPKYLPSIRCISNFDEINVRTYIDNDNKQPLYEFILILNPSLNANDIANEHFGLPNEGTEWRFPPSETNLPYTIAAWTYKNKIIIAATIKGTEWENGID